MNICSVARKIAPVILMKYRKFSSIEHVSCNQGVNQLCNKCC